MHDKHTCTPIRTFTRRTSDKHVRVFYNFIYSVTSVSLNKQRREIYSALLALSCFPLSSWFGQAWVGLFGRLDDV